ncbi:Gfo/Idh/MocA family protein [Propioniciclava soli]|uniref:Gfo/Idh/MocA family oxidoreductase n=1 Tax=Propioniciclava soli TaxID=2775081 RepID=A0ABZ3C7L3_9ACTN|nr:Gfo/Idh/MocA family oxidoreductase [Propioniciclava soli]
MTPSGSRTPTLPTPRTPDPAEAPPLRWGIIAPGNIAGALAHAVRTHTRQRLVACGSRSAERAEAFAREHGIERAYGSYEQLVADPEVDVVYIASPHSEHRAQALLAIEAGKHVLIEKSVTRNAAEARAVFDAAREAGVACLEAMWPRFAPRYDIVRQLLDDGALGEVETVLADHGQRITAEHAPRLHDPELAGGALLDLGVYPVSFAQLVLGSPADVDARGTLTETGVDRQVTMVLGAPGGAQAALSTTLAAKTPCAASVSGSAARVELPGVFYSPGIVRLVTAEGDAVESEQPAITGSEGLCHQVAHLAQLIADGRTESPLLSPEESVAVMTTMDDVRAQVGVRYPGE